MLTQLTLFMFSPFLSTNALIMRVLLTLFSFYKCLNDGQCWLIFFSLIIIIFAFSLGFFLGRWSVSKICIMEEITQRKKAELNLKKSNALLKGISLAQSQFITNTDPKILFNDLLENFLNLTESEYGFMGEILYTDQEQAYVEETYIKLRGKSSLKTQGLTDITWDEETRKFSAQNAPQDMEFHNLNTLFGAVITTGKAVIANNPATDPRRGGLPQGHPPLNAFLGLPFYQNNQLAGMVGIANRKNGYDQHLIDYLQPF